MNNINSFIPTKQIDLGGSCFSDLITSSSESASSTTTSKLKLLGVQQLKSKASCSYTTSGKVQAKSPLPFRRAWRALGTTSYMEKFGLDFWKERHPGTTLNSHLEKTQTLLQEQIKQAKGWELRDIHRFKDLESIKLFVAAQALESEIPNFTIAPVGTVLGKGEDPGMGGTYLAQDRKSQQRYIVKVGAEDVGGIHNRNGFAHPFSDHLLIRPVSPYRGPQKEALAWQIANHLGIGDNVAQSVIAVMGRSEFHSFGEGDFQFLRASDATRRLYGSADKERVVCVQRFVENSMELGDVLRQWDKKPNLRLPFNHTSFDNALLITQLIGDTDGTEGNFRVVRRDDQWHLVKIDSSLSFPFHNGSFMNALTGLPNADRPLSAHYRQVIAKLDAQKLLSQYIDRYDLTYNEKQAFYWRVELMKNLVSRFPGMTYRELAIRLRTYGSYYKKHRRPGMSSGEREILHHQSWDQVLGPMHYRDYDEARRNLLLRRPPQSQFRPSSGGLMPLFPQFRRQQPSPTLTRLMKEHLRRKLSMPKSEKDVRFKLYQRTGNMELVTQGDIADVKAALERLTNQPSSSSPAMPIRRMPSQNTQRQIKAQLIAKARRSKKSLSMAEITQRMAYYQRTFDRDGAVSLSYSAIKATLGLK